VKLMEREEEIMRIDLGAATKQTQGPGGIDGDEFLQQDRVGLADD